MSMYTDAKKIFPIPVHPMLTPDGRIVYRGPWTMVEDWVDNVTNHPEIPDS